LPNMPLRNMNAATCEAACAANKACLAYVFMGKGCETEETDACYLKNANNSIAVQAEVYASCAI
jgi:hypothetical protein